MVSKKKNKELRKAFPNAKINIYKYSVLKKCEFCGELFLQPHHLTKFCSDECYRKHRNDYKNKWKEENWKPTKERLGTSNIDGKAKKDFNEEMRIVRREKQRLKARFWG